jgi:predicted Rossmann fold flavoprotein
LFHKIIVIGGGASGIMAAVTCSDFGEEVAIIEGQNRIGKKLLITGNGRCNISNINTKPSRYHSHSKNFFIPVLEAFSCRDTERFFEGLGLPLTVLDEGKMYPMSLQASSVIDILRFSLDERSVPIYLNTNVIEIEKSSKGFKIITNSNEEFTCEKVILASGGTSASNTGSNGSGYRLAKKLGHEIITPIPALVQLKLNYDHLKALSGVKFNGFVEIYIDNNLKGKDFGEILFTDYGISGPPILQLSRIASLGVFNKSDVMIKLDLIPNLSNEDLKDYLYNHWGIFSYRSVIDSFIGIVNKKLIPILLKQAGVSDIHKPCMDLTWQEKSKIISLLKHWEFQVTDTNSFSNAQVTAGGVNTKQVNSSTLESNIVKNLFFCGEVLDVDGDCGGFNLQWAWSSGFVAAKSACNK